MSKVNLDTTEKLDITCRQGDTFQLTLTLKDSSGTGLALVTDDYKFLMQVRGGADTERTALRVPSQLDESTDSNIVIGSSELGAKGAVNFSFNDVDNSGNVTVFVSARDMRSVPPGRYKYDLQYVTGTTEKTILEGRFTVNGDVSKSL